MDWPKIRTRLIKSFAMTLLAFAISMVLASPVSFSAMTLFSAPEKTDFTVSDFYQQVANHRPVETLDPDVVIVDIGDMGREDIADVLEVVAMAEPKAVGVDITFIGHRTEEIDGRLIESVKRLPNPVMAMTIEDTDTEDLFYGGDHTFFVDEIPDVAEGVINFPVKMERGTIRNFKPYFNVKGERGDVIEYPSFAVALAQKIKPEALDNAHLLSRHELPIDYPSRQFDVVDGYDVHDFSDMLKDKVVLIGGYSDLSDVHSTPVRSDMPGIEMHALVLSQILGERYFTSSTPAMDYIGAFLLCFTIIYLTMCVPVMLKGMLLRVLQLVTVWLAIQLGYMLYVDYRMITNFSYILLIITFGLFAVDLWNGTVVAIEWVRLKHRQRQEQRKKKDVGVQSQNVN